jgi:RND family efflux transporter MFP subunit
MNMKRKMLVIGGGILLISIVIVVLCLPKSGGIQAIAKRYDFFPVRRMNLSEKIEATGQVLALEKKDLYTDYDGVVEKVNYKSGDFVKKGDILLSITSASLKQQWQDANSTLKQAQVNVNLTAGQLATEVAINHVSTTNALQLENYYHQMAIYKEQAAQAQQRLDALNAKNDGYYMADNEKLFIRAPFDGQVAWVNVRQGDKVLPQTILATVMKPDSLGVEAQIAENDIISLKTGQKVLVAGNDPAQTQTVGWVTEISQLGQPDTATGQTTASTGIVTQGVINFPVRVQLTGHPVGLKPGMTVDVTILANEYPNVLAVPAGSVVRKNGNDQVQIRRENKLVTVPVQLGFKHGKFWEVKSGLRAGEQVAVPKPAVNVKQTAMTGPAPGGNRHSGMAFGR